MPEGAPALHPVDAAEGLTRRIRLAARYYAARIERRGFCMAWELVDDGFDQAFLLSHWPTIRDAGEDIAARRRAAMSGPARGRP